MDDELSWSWPAWKFGMKRDDLFSKLHDQYNTFQSTIQDPEAFHHDVYEISTSASTADEFHRLLADRREQRLRELNDGLESASLEIIANPKLIGTHQWQYALQLFRSKSLDSLVRYFSSYLPDDHPWHRSYSDDSDERNISDVRTTVSSTDSAVDVVSDHDHGSGKPFFDDGDQYFMSDEPLAINTSVPASHLPPSPRSMTMCSDSLAASPVSDDVHHEYNLASLTPARTLSFSESESDVMMRSGLLPFEHDYEETSQLDDSPATSVSDISESRFSAVGFGQHDKPGFWREAVTPAVRESSAEEAVESDTPTPRNESPAGSYLSLRPSRSAASLHGTSTLYAHILQEYARSSRKNRREGSPVRTVRRKSPELGRIQKPLQDLARIRPKGRQRND